MGKDQTSANHLLDVLKLRSIVESIANDVSIQKWDIGASSSKDISAQVEKGQPKQLKAAQRSSLTIRVWNGKGLVGITSTSDVSETGLKKAFDGALQASQYGNRDDIPDFSPLAKLPLAELNRPFHEAKSINAIFTRLSQAESQLLNSHPAIKSIPYNGLSEANIKRIYLNSDGADRELISSQSSIYLYALAEEVGRKPRSSGAVRVHYGSDGLDIQGCIDETRTLTLSHLNYEPILTGKYLVCFSPDAFLDLINAFSSIFNARSILDGVSLSDKESIGTTISVPFLSIYDNPTHINNIGASSFDGEGTPTKELCLLNKGVITNFLHSEATAREFRVKPTGHAGFGAKVGVSPDWLVIKPAQDSQAKMESLNHNQTDNTFVLIESLSALHAGIKSSQGSFSLPFDGWLINNGEKISIEAATIAGDIKKLLKQIVQIENELVTTPNGISPYIWVDGLSITGES